jgi:hypothetical protein
VRAKSPNTVRFAEQTSAARGWLTIEASRACLCDVALRDKRGKARLLLTAYHVMWCPIVGIEMHGSLPYVALAAVLQGKSVVVTVDSHGRGIAGASTLNTNV